MLLIAITLMTTVQETPAPQATPTPTTTAAAKPARDPNKITCISRVKTGSRTNFEQVCHTQAEWERIRSENRRVVERGQANRGLKDE